MLWLPLIYFLRRAFIGGSFTGGVWALLLGSITAFVQFFLGDLISPGGFGYTRALYGFIDIICIPALIPLFIYFLMILLRRFQGDIDFGSFVLLWLIPTAALRALSWSALNDPVLLILVPLLWTALAAGISFFVKWMTDNFHVIKLLVSVICIPALPVAAAVTYWAFFSQQTFLGYCLLIVTFIPFGFSVYLDIARREN